MHAYATDEDRTKVTVYLALGSVGLGQGISYLLSSLGTALPRWVDAPSTMTLFAGLFWLFNSHAWRWEVRKLRLSKIPNLRGTWVGQVRSSHDAQDTPVVVFVNQTWLRVTVRLATERSGSASTMAALNTEEATEPGLKYEYLNEPVATAIPTMHIHRGTAHLRAWPDGKTLEGNYYAGRDRMNLGTIHLRWVCAEAVSREEAVKRLALAAERDGHQAAPGG